MKTEQDLQKLNKAELVELVSDLSDALDVDLPTNGSKNDLIKIVLANQNAEPQQPIETSKPKKASTDGQAFIKALKTIQGGDYSILKDATGYVPDSDLEELLDRNLAEEL